MRPGIRKSLPQMIPGHARAHRYAVITDETVAELYGKAIVEGLNERGKESHLFTFPPGEASKTREEWARLTGEMLATGFGRDSAVVAVGGGVTGDLVGFVAATFMRGVPLVQVPTSLVAMIDSSVGGKSAVDVPEGKNLVGAFHPPHLVVVDPEVAVTLPVHERAQGLAEAVKHGAILDPVYLADLEGDIPCVLKGEVGATGRVVVRSIEIKAEVVSKDERESGLRKILNFGHTLGHAVEAAKGYALPHGSCVALGMVLEAQLGEQLGITRAGSADIMRKMARLLDLPTNLPADLEPEAVLAYTRSDKKGRGGKPRYVLLAHPGKVAEGEDWAREVPDEIVLEVLTEARG
ncbi:MAG: 3-dehydroquinate synthase [Gemmatimonadota bacterium]